MNVLITGGAGYRGSCTSNILLDEGHTVTIIDNFITIKKLNRLTYVVFILKSMEIFHISPPQIVGIV
jgi:UDP-glucose 4-epimerase